MEANSTPKLEFPCQYPIKVIGQKTDDFEQLVLKILRKHVKNLKKSSLISKPSKEGKYLAVTVTITAHSYEQIHAICADLKACKQVLVAL